MDKTTILIIIAAYLVIMNIVGIIIMKVDKTRAEKHAWRIKEATLFGVSLAGGSLGTWAGMYIFRHKTKHWYFVVGMPMIFFAHVALLVFLGINFL